jgi:Protein of unknown function (DUF3592)
MNSATKGRMFGLIGLAGFSLWATLSLGIGFYLSLRSSFWPTASAQVSSSSVSTGVSNIGRWWQAELTYEYRVGGHVYQSSTIRYLMPASDHEEEARQIQANYAEGRQTRAAFNPANPSESVLEPGVPAGMWWRALIPLFFWGLTGYIYYEIHHPERRLMLLPDIEAAGQEQADTPD